MVREKKIKIQKIVRYRGAVVTRSIAKLKGEISFEVFMRMRNCFVALERCRVADKTALLTRPDYRGRRKSVTTPKKAKKTKLRERAFSVFSRMPDMPSLEDDFGPIVVALIEEGNRSDGTVQQDAIGDGQIMDIITESEPNPPNEQEIVMVAVENSRAEAGPTAEVNTVHEENAHQIDENVNMPKETENESQIAFDLSQASVEQSTSEHNADVDPVIVARDDEDQNAAQIENPEMVNAVDSTTNECVEPSHAVEAKVLPNTLEENGLSTFISNLSLDGEGGVVLSTQTTMSVNGTISWSHVGVETQESAHHMPSPVIVN